MRDRIPLVSDVPVTHTNAKKSAQLLTPKSLVYIVLTGNDRP